MGDSGCGRFGGGSEMRIRITVDRNTVLGWGSVVFFSVGGGRGRGWVEGQGGGCAGPGVGVGGGGGVRFSPGLRPVVCVCASSPYIYFN